MEFNLIDILVALATVANTLALIVLGFRRSKPEIKKMEREGESEIADAFHGSVEAATLSSQMLKARIDELQQDLTTEKKSRRDDADYFRRRIKDIEKEARDYRLWAARLAKQVIEAGKVPVPFISSMNDSDPLITAITREQAELEKAKGTRQAELDKKAEKENK